MGELLPQAAFLCLPCSFTVCVCTWDVFLVCFSAFSAFFFLPIMMIIAFSPFKRIIVGVHGAFVALPAVARVAGAIVGGCATRT